MYDAIPDYLRKSSILEIFQIPTFRDCWSVWQPEITRLLGHNYDENQVLNLGDHLSDIFRQTGGVGRGQGELSASGTAWEALVCWYVNLCTVNSRVVAFRRMGLVPQAIQDAITVNYGNFACNTESDITLIVFPNQVDYTIDIHQLNVTDNIGTPISALIRDRLNPNLINHLAARDFHEYEIGIIQCKTNWNDNAQIPMLWDMIYSAGGFPGRNITIGKNGFNIQNAQRFTYSFVTVPTNKSVYSPNGVSVKRVTNLSGGNYWGQPTVQNVARSLKEIFTSNFPNSARTTLRTDIRTAIPSLSEDNTLSYFGL
ncbi:MAG: hypothetical protein WAT92_04080 [Saprospiraceae bacterium]